MKQIDDKSNLFNVLINNVIRITKSARSKNEKLHNICKLLKENVPNYDWVGFYIADENNQILTLGPYSGEPTEHSKIPFGKGICGQAAANKKPFVVQDVTLVSNYLSCSPKVKSEIVLPILKNGKIKAELDIDSHTNSPFTGDDEQFLSDVCNIVSQLF